MFAAIGRVTGRGKGDGKANGQDGNGGPAEAGPPSPRVPQVELDGSRSN